MKKQGMEHASIHLSYLLRHAPESAGLDMDHHGWVSVSQLIENVNASGKAHLTIELLQKIVDTDNKGRYRFSQDGKRIKACQGHSIPWVEPELEIRIPPEFLFHGTTTEALRDIMISGAILRMKRHAVHLRTDISKAWQSAIRRKNRTPVVLKIAAKKIVNTIDNLSAAEAGAKFSVADSKGNVVDTITTGENGVGTSKNLPYGTYTVTQISGQAGTELCESWTVTINEHE